MRPLATIDDHRELARRRLPRFLFDYIDGGSFSEATLRANEADFGRIALRQRVMRDVSEVATAVTLFGRTQPLPIVLGPVGLAGMYARRGEAQAARAAHSAGPPLCLSSVSICDIACEQQTFRAAFACSNSRPSAPARSRLCCWRI